jgi:pimeloyl-ACP methyl ester carboxylesterase
MILQVDGVKAHVVCLGKGEPLLLLHGWGPASVSLEQHFLPLAHILKDRYSLTLIDFPGHGESGAPSGNWGVAEYSAWTLKVMDELALRKTAILAHSFGGRVALWLAVHHPERVSRLILTGCAGIKPKKTIKGRLRTLLFRLGRGGLEAFRLIPGLRVKADRVLAALRAEFSSGDYLATPENLRGSFSRIVRQDLRPLLPKIAQPTLLVWGEKDRASPLWMGRMMESLMPDARLLVYEEDDHFAYMNQIARFATAADVFMGGGKGA